MSATEDLLERMFDRADKMFKRADKMFENLAKAPIGKTIDNDGMFDSSPFWTTTTLTTTAVEPLNPPVEYLVRDLYDLTRGGSPMEEGLNDLGSAGWDLIHFDGARAIFSRLLEKAEEEDNA